MSAISEALKAADTPENKFLVRVVGKLLAFGTISEDYAVDLLAQIAFFDKNQKQLEAEYDGKYLAICGGKVFADDSFGKATLKAKSEFPCRPYYAVYVTKVQGDGAK
jgi:hypothetical protein